VPEDKVKEINSGLDELAKEVRDVKPGKVKICEILTHHFMEFFIGLI
jgi:hypothetical protein